MYILYVIKKQTEVKKMNKQLKTLIAWCKKYMDCDTTLITHIEGVPVNISTDVLHSGNICLTVVEGSEIVYGAIYNFELMKWKKEKVE